MTSDLFVPLRRLIRDRDGIAAIDFAMALPVLVLLLVATLELGNLLTLDRKVTKAVQTAADLVAQDDIVTTADLDDVYMAVSLILQPFDAGAAGTSIYSVVMDDVDENDIFIDWQERRGPGAPPVSANNLPAGLLSLGRGVIVAEINYAYEPLLGDIFFDGMEVSDRAFLRPRLVPKIPGP